MEQPGRCEHCGGEIYSAGDDQWWVCAECGCTWATGGELIRRGPDCTARESGALARQLSGVGVAGPDDDG